MCEREKEREAKMQQVKGQTMYVMMSSNRTSEAPQVARHLARQLQLLIRAQARPLEPEPERHVRRVRRPHLRAVYQDIM